jgi:hypothetical protein
VELQNHPQQEAVAKKRRADDVQVGGLRQADENGRSTAARGSEDASGIELPATIVHSSDHEDARPSSREYGSSVFVVGL